MGLRDRLATLREYLFAAFVSAPDHPGRGGMTGDTGEEGDDDEE